MMVLTSYTLPYGIIVLMNEMNLKKVESDNDINLVGEDQSASFLTQNNYEGLFSYN